MHRPLGKMKIAARLFIFATLNIVSIEGIKNNGLSILCVHFINC